MLKTLAIANITAVLVDRTQKHWLLCDLDNSFFCLVHLWSHSSCFCLGLSWNGSQCRSSQVCLCCPIHQDPIMKVRLELDNSPQSLCVCVCLCLCVCSCVCLCVYVWFCLCVCICVYVCMHVCDFVCMCIFMCVSLCVGIYA